ncbi:MAG: uroporphyrinogen decarboxylase/cobalamine-independent methonine synthase family protein [Armatimonadota bacterium]
MSQNNDILVLRDLAKQYAEIANDPIQEERRKLWSQLNSLKRTRPLVMATFGIWNVWCREVFGDAQMRCEDPFYRGHERALRMQLFQYAVGDDCIQEPWITQGASVYGPWRQVWGVNEGFSDTTMEGGARHYEPPIKEWKDVEKMTALHHQIDEEETARNVAKLKDAVGDILEVNVERGPALQGFMADISTSVAGLRGLEQIMVDMYESPEELHRLLAFMRDGILQNQQEAEQAGDFHLTTQSNQSMPYAEELERPQPNSGSRKRNELWCHCAAQEFTLISPEMHDEFLLQYQLPIMKHFGLVAYGCCENLTNKIDMLRQIPNLRHIAVTPTADVAKCAEQIKTDYVVSWRPNPTDMVCYGFDEEKIRTIIRDGMEASKGCHVTIHLKDIETVEGDPDRLAKWVQIVRSVTDSYS